MSRIYSVTFNGVTVSAVQDLFEIEPAANKPVELISATITVKDSETNEQLTCTVQRRTGAYTDGSGGSSPTIQKRATNDAAAGFTVRANSTTRCTGGTQEILHSEGWPSQGGWGFTPIPGAEPMAINGENLIIGLENAPGVGIPVNGTVWVREL